MDGMAAWMAVALGGALGSVSRFVLGGWVQGAAGGFFPYGTLTVNVTGSLIIGLVLGLGADRFPIAPGMRLFLTTGFCGGFTTFSTFSYETIALIEDQRIYAAAGNILGDLSACLLATLLGLAVARAV